MPQAPSLQTLLATDNHLTSLDSIRGLASLQVNLREGEELMRVDSVCGSQSDQWGAGDYFITAAADIIHLFIQSAEWTDTEQYHDIEESHNARCQVKPFPSSSSSHTHT